MKKKCLTFIIFLLLFSSLIIALLSSCLNEKKIIRNNRELPKAYWNQEEHDRAMHSIYQPRDLNLNINLHTGEDESSGNTVKLYTGKKKYGSDEEFKEIIIGQNRTFDHQIHYTHSFIGLELTLPLVPSHHGIAAVLFSWYRPGTRVKTLDINIDISSMYCIIYPERADGIIPSDLVYHKEWEEKKVWVRFERLCAITSTPREHPGGLKAQEAHIIRHRDRKGKMTILLDMPGFFKKWHKSFAHPWQKGDIFTVSLSLTLLPPHDLFHVTLSDKKDRPFVPREYNGKVDANDGDPYLVIPSTKPLEEVIIEAVLKIIVTDVMLNF